MNDAHEANTVDLVAVNVKNKALEWYAAQVLDGRKTGLVGDIARAKLDRDGGYMATQALAGLDRKGDKQ